MNFSIVIPAFNESKNLINLLKEIKIALSSLNKFEIIIIDDCSYDNTVDLLNNNKNQYPHTLIKNKKNLGQSNAILVGINNARYETVVTIDADLQNNPFDIPKLINIYFSDLELKLVGGIRIKRNDNLIKIISSRLANYIRKLILKDDCNDTGCSLKVFDKKIFLSFPFFDGIHRFLPALFKGFGHKTKFINVSHRKRIYGISKYGTFKRLVYGIIDIYRVKNIIKKNKN